MRLPSNSPRGGSSLLLEGRNPSRRLQISAASTSFSATKCTTPDLFICARTPPSSCAETISPALKNYRAVPVEPLAGKIVIDTNNYSPERDGHIPELDNESTTTSELLQAHLPTSKVVKAFNHIYAAALTTDGQPAGTKNRRALVIAGDDEGAKAAVTRLLNQFGFDTVDAGPLKEGWRIQRDTPGYGPRRPASELRQDLAAAKRYADQQGRVGM